MEVVLKILIWILLVALELLVAALIVAPKAVLRGLRKLAERVAARVTGGLRGLETGSR